MRGSIHVSERKKNEYKTRQTSGREIPGFYIWLDIIVCDWVIGRKTSWPEEE